MGIEHDTETVETMPPRHTMRVMWSGDFPCQPLTAARTAEEKRFSWSPTVLRVYRGSMRFEAPVEVELEISPDKSCNRERKLGENDANSH